MARACAKLRSAIINLSVSHDGNPGLARHITNAVVKETPEGAYITKEHRHSSRKIDLATAAIIAHDRATDHNQTNRLPKKRDARHLSGARTPLTLRTPFGLRPGARG